MNERELFLAALEIEDPDDRRAHLQSACAADAKLLGRVEALLASHEGQSRFLSVPVAEQLAQDAAADSNVTVLLASTTTDDAGLDAGASPTIGPGLMTGIDDHADEISLDFLQPSSRPNSLGRLAHYEIVEVLGQGAFGIVLKAFDEKLHRIVAIKVLSPHLAATSPARKRFLREARSSAAVRHENVVSIHNVEDEPIPYLVMEFIPGETLQKRLDDHGPLDLSDVLRLGKQIADGLAAAHAQELIHRDVKPGNVLLDTSVDDHVKLTDFGLARTVDDASMSQSGMIAGTPLYMAPEQALGQKLDQRADLFSFGSVLYHMLSGRPPFRAPSTVAVLKRVAEDTPRPIQEIIPEVPDWMCELIGHLHAKNPDERYGSAKAVGRLLAASLADVEHGRLPSIPAPGRDAEETVESTKKIRVVEQCQPRTARRARHRPLLRIAALVLVVLIAGLGITEATHVSHLATTVIRLATGSGTLVIETDDPDVKIAIDGEEITISGGGVAELKVRPGKHEVVARKGGKLVKQELVTITRNGQRLVRIAREVDEPDSITAPPVAGTGGWQELFNGRDLSGWKTHPKQLGNWRVEDGVLVADGPPISHLFTERGDYRNFHVYMEVKINETGDGGLIFRSEYGPIVMRGAHGYPKGYEVQIMKHWDRTGELVGLKKSSATVPDADAWIALEVIALDNHLVTKVNGHVAADYHDKTARYRQGHLALQCGGSGWKSKLLVRKLLIKELPVSLAVAPAVAPFTDADVARIAALPAAEQIEQVRQELMRRNPGFDGQLRSIHGAKPKIEEGIVTEIRFCVDQVSDISPLRALKGLRAVWLQGSTPDRGKLSDLSPLKGMELRSVSVGNTPLTDLSPLAGMPITVLGVEFTNVESIAVVKEMPITALWIMNTQVADLSPLAGKSLNVVRCTETNVKTLRGLPAAQVRQLFCDAEKLPDEAELARLGVTHINGTPLAEFSKAAGAIESQAVDAKPPNAAAPP